MARDPSVADDGKSGGKRAEGGDLSSDNTLLDRRSYLKLAGSATAAAAVMAGSASAAGEEYEVIEADNKRHTLRDGDVLENVVIDFSNGNYYQIYAAGDCTIRNVGFKGTHEHDQHCIVVGGSGDVLIENCYLGDGCVRPDNYSSHGQCGIFAHRDFSGNLTIRRCNVQNWPNNGIYANAPHYSGGGRVTIEECYGANNYVSTFRIGSDGSSVNDSIAHNDGGRYNGRPVWLWGESVEVNGCELDSGSYAESIHIRDDTRATIRDTVHDGYHGGDPVSEENVDSSGGADTSMPDYIPSSPEEAAGGATEELESLGDHSDLQYVYEFIPEADEPFDYYFEVEEGPIEFSTYNGAEIEEEHMWVSDDGSRAAGCLTGTPHAWEFDALLVDVTVEGDADVRINDQQSHLSRYPREGATGDDWKGDMPWHEDDEDGDEDEEEIDESELEHSYEFIPETDEPVDYYFEVEEGPIVPSTYNGAEIEEDFTWVSEDGSRAAGRLTVTRHAWKFDTLLVDVTVEGDADVRVNDQQSHLSRYPREGATGDDWKGDMPWHRDDEDEDALDRTILIDGVGRSGTSNYEFTVTGDVEKSTYRSASIGDDTIDDDGTVTGSVSGWRDAFRFDGEIEDLSVDGTARVLIDDEEVDPSDYGQELDHVLTIVGNGSDAEYRVSVDGAIETIPWDASDEYATVVSSGTAEGTIERGFQRFRYSGSVTDLAFESGSAHVYADLTRLDPDDF
ncbi:right-handed parallel beta-helix repeat-containing protein [Natrialbaceae archaeon GCM10025810]|uniref:right-handed parallel beta-helix repeat-containing protein n=1 Tax=Halovalidus salilacus TaxID=3075124 RepID=UPI0036233777